MGFIDTHASDQEVYTQLLVRVDLPSPTGTLYLTDSFIPIRYDSQTWSHRGFTSPEIDRNRYDLSGGLTLSFGNADNYWSAIMLGTSGVTGSPVYIYEAWFTVGQLTTAPQEVKLLRIGRLSKPVITSESATFDVVAFIDLEARRALSRDYSLHCQFVYKDGGCQANGSDTSCDHTLAACKLPTKVAPAGSITNRARASNFATLTTGSAHGLATNQTIQVYGMSDSSFDGVFVVVSTPTSTTFTVYNPGSGVASTSESTGKVNPRGPGNSINYGGIPYLLLQGTASA